MRYAQTPVIAVAIACLLGGALAPVLSPAWAQPASTDEMVAQRRAEQATPRKAIALDPAAFDKFVGYYQIGPGSVFTVHRDGTNFFARLTAQTDVQWFPESPTKFFATQVQAQIDFDSDAQGNVTGLVLHQNGFEQPAKRIDEATAKSIEDGLARRIAANTPAPGSEQALRHQIDALENGALDYSAMAEPLAFIARPQATLAKAQITRWGPLKSITFKSVGMAGADIYDVAFENQLTEWRISPPNPDGKIRGLGYRPLP